MIAIKPLCRVPIAMKTLPFWIALKEQRKTESPYSQAVQYRKFVRDMEALMKTLGLREHLPHDTRHTTATLLHEAGVDLYVVKRILGHNTQDVTESVYTHIHDEEFLRVIDSI